MTTAHSSRAVASPSELLLDDREMLYSVTRQEAYEKSVRHSEAKKVLVLRAYIPTFKSTHLILLSNDILSFVDPTIAKGSTRLNGSQGRNMCHVLLLLES